MKGVIEVFTITGIVLCLFAICRHFWRKFIAPVKENKHALLEGINIKEFTDKVINLEITYRLPVSGTVIINGKVDGVVQDQVLNKNHKAGYYSFKLAIDNPGNSNKICFKAPGTYLEKDIKKP